MRNLVSILFIVLVIVSSLVFVKNSKDQPVSDEEISLILDRLSSREKLKLVKMTFDSMDTTEQQIFGIYVDLIH